jgi:HlyD family secretion protein
MTASVNAHGVAGPEPGSSRLRRLGQALRRFWQRQRVGIRLAIVSGLLLAGVVIILLALRGKPAAVYQTTAVSKGVIARAVTATGSVNPVLTIIVGSYVSGVIQDIHCDFNTQVKKGQVCAKIDPRPYQSVVDQDKASLNVAQAQLVKDMANLAYADISERRQAKLWARQATSQDSYDVALNARNQARAQVALDRATIAQRTAELHAAQVNLGYTDIVSPVDGIVVSRNVTIGQTVAASFQTPTLFLIATDLNHMEVDTNVSEGDIGDVRVGDRAEFTVEAFPSHLFHGIVAQVRQAPQTVQNVVTYDVVVTVDNQQLLLKPGMTATVRIITAERDNVLRVPNQALRFTPAGVAAETVAAAGNARLWILKDGRPRSVAVKTGLANDTYTEVVSGKIKVGDPVITFEQEAAVQAAVPARAALRFGR